MIIKRLSHSPHDTFQLGLTIGQQLNGTELILLDGDLGTGKTVLTKGIAQALGVEPEEVVSPTFTLVNEFRGTTGTRLFHFDLYRLGPAAGSALPEVDDYLDEGVIIIEWAQFLDPAYFHMKQVIRIQFQLIPEDDALRHLIVESNLPLTL